MKKTEISKIILLIFIVISYLPVLASQSYDPESVGFWARFIGLTGVVTLSWQYLLGARGVISYLIPDLQWLNGIHKRLGKYGASLILAHPLLMFIYYTQQNIPLIGPQAFALFGLPLIAADIAFAILFVIWIQSALLRTRITYRTWYKFHVFNYLILPLALFHSVKMGSNASSNNTLQAYWLLLSAIYIAVLSYRLLYWYGLFRYEYKVVEATLIAKNTTRIRLAPQGKKIQVIPGQFIYMQRKPQQETHPFTVSHFDSKTGEISLSVKNLGPFTQSLQQIQVNEVVRLDGPYGVFTREVTTTAKPIVLIAGGIGITPFIWILHQLDQGQLDKNITLFYGNRTQADAAYADVAQSLATQNKLSYIPVNSDEPDFSGEKGYITLDLIRKYLGADLSGYDFFLSGPPIMIKTLTKEFKNSGLPKNQVHVELFTL